MKKTFYQNKASGARSRIAMTAVIGILCLALGAAAAYVPTKRYYQGIISSIRGRREAGSPYKFIQPLLWLSVPAAASSGKFDGLISKIGSLAAAEPQGAIARYSVYLRDLVDGRWGGISPNDGYDPASTFKVVFAIAAYHQDESHPGFLDRRLAYTAPLAAVNEKAAFASSSALVVGRDYSVRSLIAKMLSESDNGAKNLLLSATDPAELDGVLSALSVSLPSATGTAPYVISPLDYSRFFRILFNATYLTRADSDSLLGLLAESSYKDGLVAGLPEGVPAAHKFGIHLSAKAGSPDYSIELHDCGIAYPASADPYFLCVMTQGSDLARQADFIAKASAAAYEDLAGAER